MVKWLRDFWYQDLPDEMQRKMLAKLSSNRPQLLTWDQLVTWENRKYKRARSYRGG